MLKTEMRNPNTMHIDRASTEEMLDMIQKENMNAALAVGAVLPSIAKACDAIVDGLEKGGRLIYIGAGTSGRLGVLDAAECPPTFGVSPDLVIGILAGGESCMFRASEGAEDSAEAGVADIKAKNLTAADRVVGISAAGNAAYVLEALNYAKSVGCTTIGVTSNEDCRLYREADIVIVTDTGAEAVTGSTRMKAGSAQKMVLNMLSTVAMIKTGKVCENLMINLRPTNEKLRRRVISIVRDLLKVGEEEALARLEAHNFSIREVVDAANA